MTNNVIKFRKKPVVIEAILWDGTHAAYCLLRDNNFPKSHKRNSIFIQTLEGSMECKLGDWIIKGVNGEFYPCKPDIFEKTYEEVTEE